MDINEMTDNKNNSDDLRKSMIQTSIISSLVTVILILIILVIGFQPIRKMNENTANIINSQKDIVAIKKSLEISRTELETQVKDYIAYNYGELSERDEKVDKLLIYFRQQDARLINIENALSKF